MCEVEDGWWKGRAGGRVGVFPSNFVEMCPEDGEVSPIILIILVIFTFVNITPVHQVKAATDKSDAATVEAKNKKNSLGANRCVTSRSKGTWPHGGSKLLSFLRNFLSTRQV